MAKHECRVLVVEDSPGDVRLLMEAAEKRGIHLEECCVTTGQDLLDWLDTSGHKPKMILLDMNLPCLSGLEVLKILKSQDEWRSIPVVMYSGMMGGRDVDAAYALHANCVVKKPDTFDDLQHLVQLLDEFWLGWVIPSEESGSPTPSPQ